MFYKAIFIFFSVSLLNFLWGRYIKHAAQANALSSAIYAGIISLVSSFITIIYISDNRMIIPAALGAFIGTYLSIRNN